MKKVIKKALYNIFDFLCEMFTHWTENGIKPTFLGWVFLQIKTKMYLALFLF